MYTESARDFEEDNANQGGNKDNLIVEEELKVAKEEEPEFEAKDGQEVPADPLKQLKDEEREHQKVI